MDRKRMKKLISILTVAAIFTMSFASAFSVSAEGELYTISTDDVTEAILYDHNEGAEAPENVVGGDDYNVAPSLREDEKIEVVITATDVKLHKNNADTPAEGYWVGFAVEAPSADAKMKYAFGATDELTLGDVTELETISENKKGIAFYINAGSATPKLYAMLQWFANDGVTPLSEPTTFIVDISGVSLAIDYTPVIEEAKVVDKDTPERVVYKADSYIVNPTTKEDGTILVDIAMQELAEHTNGNNDEGYWTGFAVEAPVGADGMKYAFGTSEDLNLGAVTSLETNVIDEKSGIAFYANMEDAEPNKYAKLQWYNGTEAVSNVMTFEMNLDDVEINWIKADKVSAATPRSGEVVPQADATQNDDVINVVLTAENVRKHYNEDTTPAEGYWVGFAVEAPSADAKMKYAFGATDELTLGDVTELETISENKKGIAFYINAGSATPKLYAMLQWFANDGVTPLSEPTTFIVDISNVSLAVEYTPVIDKAKVVDKDTPERVVYKADSYIVNPTTKDDGTILVDIAMQELAEHTNGNNDEGYWTGFAVEAPVGADGMKYAFGTSEDLNLGAVTSLETNVIDEKSGIAFYANMEDAEPNKYAKLQWYNGTEAVSNVMTFEMNLDDVKLNWIKADKVSAATPRSGEVAPQAEATQNDDVINVVLAAENVRKHYNEDTTPAEGYWVGFAVEAPSADAKMKYAFGVTDELTLGEVKVLETISENKKGIAFYTNAGAATPKLYAMLQWFANDGVTPLSAPTKFVIDISGVTFAGLDYIAADEIKPAKIVDQANTSVQPYATYSAVGAANENGVIVVDVDMTELKSHESIGQGAGHWTGFAIAAPAEATHMKVVFDTEANIDWNDASYETLEPSVVGNDDGVAFYTNANASEPKTVAMLQWYNGSEPISNVTTIKMDISGVKLYVAPQPPRGGGGGSVNYYTVSFNSNGGSTVASAKVKKEGTVSAPGAPVKDGFVFDGWYTDKDLTQKYDFSSVVTKSFTLYAKWTKAEGEATGLKFIDIKKDAWYYDVVKTIVEKGLMNGISETEFAPELQVTRAMFVTILYRAAGEPEVEDAASFADVSADAYYAKAVAWANANGIVTGITENEFAPDNNITREQMATILYRYAKKENKSGEITYTDKDAISDYALDATAWANAAGIMKGNEDGSFAPLRNASRAEAAAVFVRLLNL